MWVSGFADNPQRESCSKNNRFMNSRRRELCVNSRKSNRAAGCANHCKLNSCATLLSMWFASVMGEVA
jgi:hypothetical protein